MEGGAQARLIGKFHLLYKTGLSRLGEVTLYLMCRNQHRVKKIEEKGNMFQMKVQDKAPETNLNEVG